MKLYISYTHLIYVVNCIKKPVRKLDNLIGLYSFVFTCISIKLSSTKRVVK